MSRFTFSALSFGFTGLALLGCSSVDGLWGPVPDDTHTPPQGGSGGSASEAGAGGSSSAGSGGVAPPGEATLAIDTESRFQTLEGFGASVAWYGDWLTQHPNKAEIYRLVFRELGLDILRLRNTYRHDDETDAAVPFDPIAVELVEAATSSLGRTPKVLLSSWSPPADVKANGATDCAGEATCTLRSDADGFAYGDFAAYWRDSVSAYVAAGVPVDMVSIQNEPDFTPPSWEGCRFDPVEGVYPSYVRALEAVRAELDPAHPGLRYLGPEVISLSNNRLGQYTSNMSADSIDIVAHHLYDGASWMVPDSLIPRMREAAQALPGKPMFQTEFSVPGGGGAFEIAWLIRNSLAVQGSAAYLHWDLIWKDVDGLVSVEDPDHEGAWTTPKGYAVRDDYYSVQHFARYTDPGDVRVAVESSEAPIKAVAFLSPTQDRISLVVLNTASNSYFLDWSAAGFVPSTTALYRTGANEHFQSLGELAGGGRFELGPRSIATLVITR